MPDPFEILNRFWGYESFRPMQEDIIRTVLNKNDCLALMPTGGGKSLCFQIPAMTMPGLCLVISPLIALMKDQVESLRKKNITAFSIHSGLSRKEVIATLKLAGSSNCKFLYIAPERIETNLFREYLHGLGVNLIAVDEAHCISQWGYDFRPAYLKIGLLREELPAVPLLALTASATPVVQKDICEKLSFKEKKVFRLSFQRPNLSYSIFQVPSKINKIVDVLKKVDGSAIVYCSTRRKTKEIAQLLQLENISASYYHAGLDAAERSIRQDDWLHSRIRVIVCTNAFGMGIDKPDVRTVIHADTPDCLENYYQEAGRAGRDQKKSYAVLLCSAREITDLKASAGVKYPALPLIRSVYQALMNCLQIASGSGEGTTHDIDLTGFLKSFGLSATTALPALKTLEQEGLISFNEPFYVPATCEVIADRISLSEIETSDAAGDDVIKALLRTYQGIRDSAVVINEKVVAAQVRRPVDAVISTLQSLHTRQLIAYAPQKQKPQVRLLRNHVPASDLVIDMELVDKRKAAYQARVDAMVRFITATEICRSTTIGRYFGDEDIEDCGICDICLARKKSGVSRTEFDAIHQLLLSAIRSEPRTISQIMEEANHVSREKILEVVKFLQTENRITITDRGAISLI